MIPMTIMTILGKSEWKIYEIWVNCMIFSFETALSTGHFWVFRASMVSMASSSKVSSPFRKYQEDPASHVSHLRFTRGANGNSPQDPS